MANPAFGKNLSFCGTSSRVFTRFVVALVIVNKYNIYVQYVVLIENPRKFREKRRGGPDQSPRRHGPVLSGRLLLLIKCDAGTILAGASNLEGTDPVGQAMVLQGA